MPRSARLPVHTSLPLPSSLHQIDGLQLLRAVAVISVAWLHGSEKLFIHSQHRLPDLGVFGVDIFFVISGFILSSVAMRERRSPGFATMGNFLKRRLLRIYPLYWIFALLAIARLTLSHQPLQARYVPAFFLVPPLQYPAFPLLHEFSWTLIFEVFFYALLSLLLLKTIRLAVPALIAILLLLVTAGVLFDIHRPVWIILCNPILLEFAFGAALALLFQRIGRRRNLGIALTFAGAALAVFFHNVHPATVATGQQMITIDAGVFTRVATFGLAALILVSGIVLWSPALHARPGRLFVILGNASYSTYLISSIGIEFALRVAYKLVGYPSSLLAQAACNSLSVIAVLAAGWLLYDLVEWPMLRSIQARLAKQASRYVTPPPPPPEPATAYPVA
jgi:exopolysaccharide production protein ExoZ